MTAVLEPPKTREVLTEGVLLHNISWSTYESLLRDYPESTGTRFTYDRGDLLIMVASLEHEEINGLISILISIIVEEFNIEWRGFGSVTYKRKDLKRGFDPDSSFYFKNEGRMRGKKRLNLPIDPPPDMVVEVDITHPTLNKLPLFASFGIPEVWRFDGRRLDIHQLSGSKYVKVDSSLALPILTSDAITNFITQGTTMSRLEWVKNVRTWARQQNTSGEK